MNVALILFVLAFAICSEGKPTKDVIYGPYDGQGNPISEAEAAKVLKKQGLPLVIVDHTDPRKFNFQDKPKGKSIRDDIPEQELDERSNVPEPELDERSQESPEEQGIEKRGCRTVCAGSIKKVCYNHCVR